MCPHLQTIEALESDLEAMTVSVRTQQTKVTHFFCQSVQLMGLHHWQAPGLNKCPPCIGVCLTRFSHLFLDSHLNPPSQLGDYIG